MRKENDQVKGNRTESENQGKREEWATTMGEKR